MKRKKYELDTEDTIKVKGHTLYRIVALESFFNPHIGDIKAGDKGGYIESENNLLQDGNCWISDNARVYGGSLVCDNAVVYGNALVWSSIIQDCSVISDSARIIRSNISGDSYVRDNSEIVDSEIISSQTHGCSVITESKLVDSLIDDKVIIENNAIIEDCDIVDSVIISNINLSHLTLSGDAVIKNEHDHIIFKNNFSSGRYFIWTKSNDMWDVGCFHGTGQQLIKKAYRDDERKGKYYEAYVNLVESFKEYENSREY